MKISPIRYEDISKINIRDNKFKVICLKKIGNGESGELYAFFLVLTVDKESNISHGLVCVI